MERKIIRIELEENQSYEVFVKKNEKKFWDLIITSIEKLSEDKELNNYTAFIVFGGKLKNPKEIVVNRSGVNEIIDNALVKMETYEEYEMCDRLIKLQKKFD